jgi:hypothetical protein
MYKNITYKKVQEFYYSNNPKKGNKIFKTNFFVLFSSTELNFPKEILVV